MKSITEKYYESLSKQYPTVQSICHEIIQLEALLNLPKGTEHYISDLHGEYKAFLHLMNNCSGVIKEKVIILFENEMTQKEINEFCYLVYYPQKVLVIQQNHDWYQTNILRLIRLARLITSKYTRSKVRKNIHNEYSYIIDELLHAQLDEMDQQYIYHIQIINTIIELNEQDHFIELLIQIIKYFAIDQLHILGDIFDRGKHPDKIIDDLINYDRVDIQWGNHDILWMGAYLGNSACIMTVIKNCLHYKNVELLEKGYSIPLRKFMLYAQRCYEDKNYMQAMEQVCLDLLLKLESQLIYKYPKWHMEYRHVHKYDDELNEEEKKILKDLQKSFHQSMRLKKHMEFLFLKGSLYLRTNHNLLFHGCVPLTSDGEFYEYYCFGKKLSGKRYFDEVNQLIYNAYFEYNEESIDYFWYLWCGEYSPLCGRRIVLDEPQEEIKNPYYEYIQQEELCTKILHSFHLYEKECMIINGHTPVRVKEGENPIKGNGKLVVIDGGFCMQNQGKTGVAGYTLISNSHGMRLKTHHIHLGNYDIHHDIEYDSKIIYTREKQEMVRDTKKGEHLLEKVQDLKILLRMKR